jgi:hypothetical protein
MIRIARLAKRRGKKSVREKSHFEILRVVKYGFSKHT